MKVNRVFFLLLIILLSCKNKRFNSDDWKANRQRYMQINSLIKSKILIGKSYEEVVRFLGKEDFGTRRLDSASNTTKFTIQYLTGSGQFIDLERLRIEFDSSRVIQTEKYYD